LSAAVDVREISDLNDDKVVQWQHKNYIKVVVGSSSCALYY